MKSLNRKLPRTITDRFKGYPEFCRKVWQVCATIPKGEVRSYAWVAGKAGRPLAARAVGQALARNPFAPHVPCHRVVPAGSLAGRRVRAGAHLGGYTAPGGLKAKASLLLKEGALG